MKTQPVKLPAWLTSRAGIRETVPKPWTPVRVHKDIFSCWGREYGFTGHPLPSQIVSRGAGLLARPVELACTIHGREQVWKTCDVKRVERHPRGRQAEREAVGLMDRLLLNSRATLYYEGALKIDITVSPLAPVTLASLSIRIPIRRQQAGLMVSLFSPVTALNDLPADGVKGSFSPVAWIGTEERGLTWFCESDAGWDPGADALEVRLTGNAVELNLRIIRQPRDLDKPLTLSFGLEANPWRPLPKGCDRYRNYHTGWLYDSTDVDLQALHDKGVRTLIFHSAWSDKHAYPETVYESQLKQLVRRCHRHGLKLLVYFGIELSEAAPEWPVWSERWRVMPRQKHGYVPYRGPQDPAFHVCHASEWADFIVHGIRHLMHKYDLDGVYLDGLGDWTSGCAQRLHGCGTVQPDGNVAKTYAVWKTRELLERIYAVVTSIKPAGRISLHANPGLMAGSGPFGTDCFGGEGYGCDYHKVSFSRFRALHMGLAQYGLFSDIIASSDVEYGLAMGLLHNVMPRIGDPNQAVFNAKVYSVWKAQDAFGVARADWRPYWLNGRQVTVSPVGVHTSFWNHPGRGLLLVVSNITTGAIDAQVTLLRRCLGYAGELQAEEIWPYPKPFVLQGPVLRASLLAGQCRLFFLAPSQSPLWPRMRACRQWIDALAEWKQASVNIDEWLVAGPFSAPGYTGYINPETGTLEVPAGYTGLETPYPPESVTPDFKAGFEVAPDKKQSWLKATAQNSILQLRPEVVREHWEIAYAFTRIGFPMLVPYCADNPVELHVRSHHAFRIWVNGAEVFRYGGAGVPRYGQRAFSRDENVINVILHPGWNPVLIKMVARRGCTLQFKITGPNGGTVPPLDIRALDAN